MTPCKINQTQAVCDLKGLGPAYRVEILHGVVHVVIDRSPAYARDTEMSRELFPSFNQLRISPARSERMIPSLPGSLPLETIERAG